MGNVVNGQELSSFSPGVYQYKVTVATGPVVFNISDDKGATYQPMTNGSFAASEDGMVYLSDKFTYRFDLGAGDTLSLHMVERGAF